MQDYCLDLSLDLGTDFQRDHAKTPFLLLQIEMGQIYKNLVYLFENGFTGRFTLYRDHIRAYVVFSAGHIVFIQYNNETGLYALARILLLDRYNDQSTKYFTKVYEDNDQEISSSLKDNTLISFLNFKDMIHETQKILFKVETQINQFTKPFEVLHQNHQVKSFSSKNLTPSLQALIRLNDGKRNVLDLICSHNHRLFQVIKEIKYLFRHQYLCKKMSTKHFKTATLLPHPALNTQSNMNIFSQLTAQQLSFSEEETLKTPLTMRPLPSTQNQKIEKTEKSVRIKAWVVEKPEESTQTTDSFNSFEEPLVIEEEKNNSLNNFLDKISADRKAQLFTQITDSHSIDVINKTKFNSDEMRPKTKEIWNKFKHLLSS